MEVAPNNIAYSKWSDDTNNYAGATGVLIGTGKGNTNLIINVLTVGNCAA
jgi:hypothetical protein